MSEIQPAMTAKLSAQERLLSKAKRLRLLLDRKGVSIAPDAWCARAAIMAETRGFEAIFIGGNALAGLHCGLEDWGLITSTELVDLAGTIAEAVNIPAIVDADQGGESALNVYRTVKSFQRRGVAGITIEDTTNPKHIDGETLVPIKQMVSRLKAACDARIDPDFVIIARTDEYHGVGTSNWTGTVDEVIRRGIAYREAGADAFFPVKLASRFKDQVAREVGLPLLDISCPFNEIRGGEQRIMLMSHTWRPVLAVFDELLKEAQKTGGFEYPENAPFANPLKDPESSVHQYLDADDYLRLAKDWARAVAPK